MILSVNMKFSVPGSFPYAASFSSLYKKLLISLELDDFLLPREFQVPVSISNTAYLLIVTPNPPLDASPKPYLKYRILEECTSRMGNFFCSLTPPQPSGQTKDAFLD